MKYSIKNTASMVLKQIPPPQIVPLRTHPKTLRQSVIELPFFI